eukprot:CAMPEP_0173061534 /NCGR_PEP_ID=MMETSP1102-20130122/3272_1 /TAXON_ID=49646 /ORGANISM="Geminigera sp., Strain Caron Lab Isolate" /LENGTH=162 /DNA_ID=CAMNT_0013928017 /DNA_START=131 /DNA_END=616 /DNA_ORIENTATION=+
MVKVPSPEIQHGKGFAVEQRFEQSVAFELDDLDSASERTPKLPDNSLRSARPLYRPGTNYHALSEAGPKNPHNMNTAFEQQRQSILSTGALRIRRQQEAVSGVYQHSDDFWKNASGRVMHVKQRNDRVERQSLVSQQRNRVASRTEAAEVRRRAHEPIANTK